MSVDVLFIWLIFLFISVSLFPAAIIGPDAAYPLYTFFTPIPNDCHKLGLTGAS